VFDISTASERRIFFLRELYRVHAMSLPLLTFSSIYTLLKSTVYFLYLHSHQYLNFHPPYYIHQTLLFFLRKPHQTSKCNSSPSPPSQPSPLPSLPQPQLSKSVNSKPRSLLSVLRRVLSAWVYQQTEPFSASVCSPFFSSLLPS
jgi:hypothetical protein